MQKFHTEKILSRLSYTSCIFSGFCVFYSGMRLALLTEELSAFLIAIAQLRVPLGCQAKIKLRAYHVAGRSANQLATPHPD